MAQSGKFQTKDKRNLPIFIHSELDDYGLTPIEFRVYARLARRAGRDNDAWESVDNMATAFGVAPRTIQRALQVLTESRVVNRIIRPHRPSSYELNPHSEWVSQAFLKEIQGSVYSKPKKKAEGDASGTLKSESGVTPAALWGDARDGSGVTLGAHEGTLERKVLPEGTPRRAHKRDAGVESDEKTARYSIEEMEEPEPLIMETIRAAITAIFPRVPFDRFYRKWWRSRNGKGGIGRRRGELSTLRQYIVNIEGYFETVNEGGVGGSASPNGGGINSPDFLERPPESDGATPEDIARWYNKPLEEIAGWET